MSFTAFKLEKHLCEVTCLDGTGIQCETANLTYGVHLLEYVCDKIGIKESRYFGLKYRHRKDGKPSWLQTNKFIGQQVRSKVYEFELHIKYWPSTPYIVEQDITRYQLVLEMRAKILNGELTCSMPTQALLASYLLQSELGNYEDVLAGGGYHSFISNETLQFFPDQPDVFLDRVKDFHEKHRDINPASAELLYLENARKILMYGMELHEVLDADGIRVMLGVNHEGVHIIQNGVILNKMYWANVLNLKPKQNRKIVYLKLKGTKKDDFETMKIGFISPNVVDWKRLHRCCRDQMGFFNASNPTGDKTDGKEKQARKPDPSLRYSHCAGDHYKIAEPFYRVNTVKFVEKKKLKKQDEQKNSTKVHTKDADNELPVTTVDDEVEEVSPENSSEQHDDAEATEEIKEKYPSAENIDRHEEHDVIAYKNVLPVKPQVVTVATDVEDDCQNSRQSVVSNDQSFVSECDSVIENPIARNVIQLDFEMLTTDGAVKIPSNLDDSSVAGEETFSRNIEETTFQPVASQDEITTEQPLTVHTISDGPVVDCKENVKADQQERSTITVQVTTSELKDDGVEITTTETTVTSTTEHQEEECEDESLEETTPNENTPC